MIDIFFVIYCALGAVMFGAMFIPSSATWAKLGANTPTFWQSIKAGATWPLALLFFVMLWRGRNA